MVRRILFASDFSPASSPAFTKALQLARVLKAELVVAHAVAPIVRVDGRPVGDGRPGAWAARLAAAFADG